MALITEPTLNPATLTPATAVPKTPATDQYATFKSYLEMLFAPTDHIFIQLIHSTKTHKDERGNDVKDTRLLALRPRDEVSSPSSHKELQKFEVEGWNVYVCMNPFPPATTRRWESCVEVVRNLYIESDGEKDTFALLAADIDEAIIQRPNTILESSPGKYHIVWNVDDFTPATAKPMLKALAARYGGDPQATDLHRVLRMPGFCNLKYVNKPQTKLIEENPQPRFSTGDFVLSVEPAKPKSPAIGSEKLSAIIDLFVENAEKAGLNLGNEQEHANGGVKWVLECPWAFEHTTAGSTAALFVMADGSMQFNCFHAHCAERGWSDVRKIMVDKAGLLKFSTEPNTVMVAGQLPGQAAPATKATREEQKAAEVQFIIDNMPKVSDISIARVEDMPDDCLIGRLGEACAKRMHYFPLAYSWLTLIIHAAQFVPQNNPKPSSEGVIVGASVDTGWRQNLYFAPVGMFHSGKSVAGEYSRGLLGMGEDDPPMLNIMPGSAEGLVKKIANASGQSRLVNVDEIGFLLERAALEGASFPYILDRSYYKTAYSLTTSGGKEILFNCRLSVLGGVTLPKEGAYEAFGDLFGTQSVGGMYDRFLFGLQPSGQEEYAYIPFSGPSMGFDILNLKPVTIGVDVWEAKNAWVKQYKLNPRVAESCIRVAGICAAYDGKSSLHPQEAEKSVVALAKYQTRLRLLLQPNTGKNDDGKLSSKFRSYLQRHSANGEWLSERKMLRDTNAYDFGVRAEKVLASLEFNKEIARSNTSSPTGGPSRKVIRLLSDFE